MRLIRLLPILVGTCIGLSAFAQTPRNLAGKIELVAGSVTVVDTDSKSRAPKKGERLLEGDSIVTGADGELHAELADGGVIAVRPNTAMRISSYQANGEASDTSVFGLIKGSFRSITGWIGKNSPANYKIITPTATAGVRGTDHEPLVIPEGASEGEPGTYDRVHAGASFIEGKAGRVDIAQGRVGHAAAHGRDRPRLLDAVPSFFRAPRNEKRMEGRHQKVLARVEQRRAERQKAVAAQRTREGARKAQEQRTRERLQQQKEQRAQRAERQKAAQQKQREAKMQKEKVREKSKPGHETRQQRAQQERQANQQRPTPHQDRAQGRHSGQVGPSARPGERRGDAAHHK